MMNLQNLDAEIQNHQIVVNMQILPILLMGMIMPVAMNFYLTTDR